MSAFSQCVNKRLLLLDEIEHIISLHTCFPELKGSLCPLCALKKIQSNYASLCAMLTSQGNPKGEASMQNVIAELNLSRPTL